MSIVYGRCVRCGETQQRSPVVNLQVGGWMHHDPCWLEALDEAVARSADS